MKSLVLGSASPRRAAYLTELGVCFEVVKVDYDETVAALEPVNIMQTLLGSKMRQLQAALTAAQPVRQASEQLCLVADTLVVLGHQRAGFEVLGKPADAAQARDMLQVLSGQSHQVITGVALGTADHFQQRIVAVDVDFRPLTSIEIDAYVASGEPMDKAGAYGLQGLGGAFVSQIRGSVSGVIGLPLAETLELLNIWQVPHRLQQVSH